MKRLMLVLVVFFVACYVKLSFAEVIAPEGYSIQVLEPTGGKILKPNGWFYVEGHNSSSYVWILSKEDSEKGPYETGVRIQTLIGVQKGTGKTTKDFAMNFLEERKRESEAVYSQCAEESQPFFTRTCLETKEGPYRILYSVFWGIDNLDVVVISIAGAKVEEWGEYSETFNLMSEFALIDMKRFE